jgi:hypothetical protein
LRNTRIPSMPSEVEGSISRNSLRWPGLMRVQPWETGPRLVMEERKKGLPLRLPSVFSFHSLGIRGWPPIQLLMPGL